MAVRCPDVYYCDAAFIEKVKPAGARSLRAGGSF
jgi:hypothetical protein